VRVSALNITSLDAYCVLVLRSSGVAIDGCDIGPCGARDSLHYEGRKGAGTVAPNHQGIIVAASTGVSIVDSYIHSEYRPTNSSRKPWHTPCGDCPPTHVQWGNGCGCDTGDSVFLTGSRIRITTGPVTSFSCHTCDLYQLGCSQCDCRNLY
jgi:hypothetical protein